MPVNEITKGEFDKIRTIAGCPKGSDEDIEELSLPPFYEACPNFNIIDFIKERGHPYDESNDEYRCEPFAHDVSEGKSDDLYNIHTYHTKVPPKAIMKYIQHYTKPGDVIYDAFCGSGMTGVACALLNQSNQNTLFNNESKKKRSCILSDLSVAASFIAHGYNYPYSSTKAIAYGKKALMWLKEDFGWAYKTKHTVKGASDDCFGDINYVVWSDVLICPNCGKEFVYYDIAVDKESGHKIGNTVICESCGGQIKITECEKSVHAEYNGKTGAVEKKIKEAPVLINYSFAGKKFDKKPDADDLATIDKIKQMDITSFYPCNAVPDGYNTNQPKKSHNILKVDDFYNKRSLIAYSKLWEYVSNAPKELRNLLKFWLQTVSVGFTKTNRYFSSSYSQVNRYLKGTLYIAPIRSEVSPWYSLSGKLDKLSKLIPNPECIITCMSSEHSLIPDNSIDYIFIDPPFGSNIMYSDLNLIWESWLKIFTNTDNEAIINEISNKDAGFYKNLMLKVLSDCYRVLKPNRWITIEFHNSQDYVWNILQSVISESGFVIADVRILDKQVQTMKQFSTNNSVDKDLVISAYKPKNSILKDLNNQESIKQSAWSFTSEHLSNLPVVVFQNGTLEHISEREKHILFDRMVAYHIVNNVPVPLSASEYYKGLEEHFIVRDGMYFLPNQVNEYDNAKLKCERGPVQMELFISNEKSAIAWLYSLLKTPATYSEIQPKYLQELKAVDKYEKIPELSDLLSENFIQGPDGKWYVPNITKEGDLAILREKKLLKEFEGYCNSKGQLKLFRIEAIRVGIGKLWADKKYAEIVKIMDRLPESVIQEEPSLTMYYDISLGRI